jgi:hypothetical protein
MPGQPLETDAFVLLKRPPTDAFQSLNVFSAEHGALLVLQRLPKKTSPAALALDLFDEVSLALESSNQGQTWFVREARLIARHATLGRSYDTLRLASALATLIARNPVSEESRPAIGALVRQALASFAASPRPDLVWFKSLYRFAREEGYPVTQQWLPSLPETLRDEARHLLRTPLADLEAAQPPSSAAAPLLRRLEDYLRGYTELLLD